MDNNDVELNFLKDISNEVVPSEVSLKIINQEGKKKEVQSQHETENGKVRFFLSNNISKDLSFKDSEKVWFSIKFNS